MNRMSKKRWQMIVLGMVVGALATVIAGPAAAAAGSGQVLTGSFSDDGDSTSPPATCGATVSNTDATWTEMGNWTATSGGTTNVFEGQTTATLTSTGDYAVGPLGSYQPAGPCLPPPPLGPAPGYNVPGTTVSVTSSSGAVSCPSLTGTFNRTGVTTVTVNVSGTCTVTVLGNAVSETVDVTFAVNVFAVPNTSPPYPIVGGTYAEV